MTFGSSKASKANFCCSKILLRRPKVQMVKACVSFIIYCIDFFLEITRSIGFFKRYPLYSLAIQQVILITKCKCFPNLANGPLVLNELVQFSFLMGMTGAPLARKMVLFQLKTRIQFAFFHAGFDLLPIQQTYQAKKLCKILEPVSVFLEALKSL